MHSSRRPIITMLMEIHFNLMKRMNNMKIKGGTLDATILLSFIHKIEKLNYNQG